MAKKGIGVIYTNDCDNIINIPNQKYKRKIIKSYYDKHHNKLDKIVTNILINVLLLIFTVSQMKW